MESAGGLRLILYQNDAVRYALASGRTVLCTAEALHPREREPLPCLAAPCASRVLAGVRAHGWDPAHISAVVAGGGLFAAGTPPVRRLDEAVVSDLLAARYGEHASNLCGLAAWSVAEALGIPAFAADPVTPDGAPDACTGVPRRTVGNTFGCRRNAARGAEALGLDPGSVRMLAVSLTLPVVCYAFSGDRLLEAREAWGVPNAPSLIELCFSGLYTRRELLSRAAEAGADASQIAETVGAAAMAFPAAPDGIVLTGARAADGALTQDICRRIARLAPTWVDPADREPEALAACLDAPLFG